MQDKSIRIEFNSDGTYCVSDDYSASWSTGNRAFNTSGTPIPIAFSPWNQQGYAVCCGSTRVMSDTAGVNYGEDIVLFLQWVGDMTLVLASWPSMPTRADDFFAESFGFQDPEDLFKSTSTSTTP